MVFVFSNGGDALMLQIKWLATFASALAGLFGKGEVLSWN
jgi:hypothetical protein